MRTGSARERRNVVYGIRRTLEIVKVAWPNPRPALGAARICYERSLVVRVAVCEAAGQ